MESEEKERLRHKNFALSLCILFLHIFRIFAQNVQNGTSAP